MLDKFFQKIDKIIDYIFSDESKIGQLLSKSDDWLGNKLSDDQKLGKWIGKIDRWLMGASEPFVRVCRLIAREIRYIERMIKHRKDEEIKERLDKKIAELNNKIAELQNALLSDEVIAGIVKEHSFPEEGLEEYIRGAIEELREPEVEHPLALAIKQTCNGLFIGMRFPEHNRPNPDKCNFHKSFRFEDAEFAEEFSKKLKEKVAEKRVNQLGAVEQKTPPIQIKDVTPNNNDARSEEQTKGK